MLSLPLSTCLRSRSAALLAACALLSACASTANPRDPLESYNRAMFGFNEDVDKAIIRPVAKGYEAVTPQVMRTGVANVFSNIGDVWISLNNLLQGKPLDAASDMGRFLVNSTLGVCGVIDWASDWGLEKHDEDFGQTLGRWGVGAGPFVVLPIMGPRTFRDAVGWGVDMMADPVYEIQHVPTRNSAAALRLVENRAELLPVEKALEEAALDKYAYVRDAYLQRRRSLIYDGRPPRELDDESAIDSAPVAGIPLDAESAVSQLVMLRVNEQMAETQSALPKPSDPTE
ncbi:MAG: hypothetical protein RIR70_611 [Pseudomonadota bacterium]